MKQKYLNLDIFIADHMKSVPNLKKKTKQTEYETIFYYAKNALREKKSLKSQL